MGSGYVLFQVEEIHGPLCIVLFVAEKTGKKRNFFRKGTKTNKKCLSGSINCESSLSFLKDESAETVKMQMFLFVT